LRNIEGIFKKVGGGGGIELTDIEGIFKKKLSACIYVCVCVRERVCAGWKKKKWTNLIFKGKGSSRPGKRKKFKQRKISQFKDNKTLMKLWKFIESSINFNMTKLNYKIKKKQSICKTIGQVHLTHKHAAK